MVRPFSLSSRQTDFCRRLYPDWLARMEIGPYRRTIDLGLRRAGDDKAMEKGDTLGSVAAAQYGSDLYGVVILDANRRMLKTSDYNVTGVALKEDMILRLLDKGDMGFSLYTVQQGDTLQSIAASQYGSWLYSLAIYDANKHVGGPPGIRRGAYSCIWSNAAGLVAR